MNKKISDKDKKDWQEFLLKNESLPIKDDQINKKNFPEILKLDLHGYSLDEANNKVKDFIKYSYEKGVKKLVLITGKGLHSQNEKDPYVSKNLGILKNSVPEYIKGNPYLMDKIKDIVEADIKDGGSGAYYIYLKKKL